MCVNIFYDFILFQRPIVAFSIENKIMVNAKQRRIAKSREHNPLWKANREDNESKSIERPAKRFKNDYDKKPDGDEVTKFSGTNSKPGTSVKLRAKFKLKEQALRHREQIKNENKNKKIKRKIQEIKTNQALSRKEVKVKFNLIKYT